MVKLIINKIARIIKNKKKLEEKLGVKITNRGKETKDSKPRSRKKHHHHTSDKQNNRSAHIWL